MNQPKLSTNMWDSFRPPRVRRRKLRDGQQPLLSSKRAREGMRAKNRRPSMVAAVCLCMSGRISSRRLETLSRQLSPRQRMADPCPITTHVLDTSSGMPASNLMIRLEKKDEASGEWHPLKTMRTNNDGRCPGFTQGHKLENCLYRITFETADYFRQQGKPCFYPEVVITFLVEYPEQHYHVPIILGPYGYSTYRGS